MLSRRTLAAVLAGATAPAAATAQPAASGPRRVALYASLGEELVHYEVDVAAAALARRAAVTLPANVQYAVPHPSGQLLYVASSTGGGGTNPRHHLSAWRIERASGALAPHGGPVILPYRPINIAIDRDGTHVLIAFNDPSTLLVHAVAGDGSIGPLVTQPEIPAGIVYAHQVKVAPAGTGVIVCGRGNDATASKPEDLGSLTCLAYKDGVLEQAQRLVLPAGTGPRHLAFHPSRPWVYVAVERGNRLDTYKLEGDVLSGKPLFSHTSLAEAGRAVPSQRAGAIHVHPSGRFVYLTNRADGTVSEAGQAVLAGGENSIAVFAVDEATGEPKPIAHVDTGGIEARTFAIDSTGVLLVVANQKPVLVRGTGGPTSLPASLAVFRIGEDGKPVLARKHDIDAGTRPVFWCGMVEIT